MGKVIQLDTITKKETNDHFHEYIKLNKKFILEIIESSKTSDEMKDSLYVLSCRVIGDLFCKDYLEIEDHETLLKQIIELVANGNIGVVALYFRDLVFNTPSIRKVINDKFGDEE